MKWSRSAALQIVLALSTFTHLEDPLKPSLCTAVAAVAATIALSSAAQAQSIEDLFLRRIDGVDPFHLRPETGAALIPLVRIGANDYADGVSAPAGAGRPSAREVSNAVIAQAGPIPAAGITDMVWQWGQFLDHDVGITEGVGDAFNIAVPAGDPEFDPMGTGTQELGLTRALFLTVNGIREQENEITAWVDGSNIYGSDDVRNAALRNGDGSLKTSAGGLLPFNTPALPNANGLNAPADSLFLAGDVRSNEQMGLASMHTLFVREHNLLHSFLGIFGISGDAAYDISRMIVMGEQQAITYNEFLPIVVGDAIPNYNGWRPFTDAGMRNEFTGACYRFGHTMLSPTLMRLDENGNEIANGNVDLRNAFFNPGLLQQDGIACVLRGLTTQNPQRVDPFVIDDVRSFLFGAPGSGGMDLTSLNIQRGRDHGLPSLNDTRRNLGLSAHNRYRDLSSVRSIRRSLRGVYASIEDVDLWIGGLSEDPVAGALVGETFQTVIADQFTRTRNSDRFWYERYLPGPIRAFVDARVLGVVIRDNTSAGGEVDDTAFIDD
ncbi:MAG: peroxidase family protein [Planctomycetota bacterium]